VSYTVRAAEPISVAADVAALLARNLGGTATDPRRRVAWRYLEGPFGPGVAHLLEHRSGTDGAPPSPIGCMGLGVRRYWCRGQPIEVAVLGDLAVDQRHRSLGPAMMLQRATRAYARDRFGLCLTYPNAKARPVVLRLGFRELGGMRRWAVPLRFAAHIGGRLPPLASEAVGFVLDAAAGAARRGRRLLAGGQYRLEEAGEPDARFDHLDEEARGPFPITAVRAAAFLRWRFLRPPGRPPGGFYNLVGPDGALAAYAFVEREGGVARLRDLFGRDAAAISLLLDTLLPRLRADGADAAWFSYLGPRWLDGLLLKRGFAARESRTVAVDWGQSPAETAHALRDPTRWYLTEVDQDA
jgi:hypothetical protein